MTGTYSIAEVVDDSNKRPKKTVFCFIDKDEGVEFSAVQIKSLKSVAKMVVGNGATFCNNLDEVAKYLNGN
jgi:hypothetical protein